MNDTERIQKLEEQVIRLAKEKNALVEMVKVLSSMLSTMMNNPVVFGKDEVKTDREVR